MLYTISDLIATLLENALIVSAIACGAGFRFTGYKQVIAMTSCVILLSLFVAFANSLVSFSFLTIVIAFLTCLLLSPIFSPFDPISITSGTLIFSLLSKSSTFFPILKHLHQLKTDTIFVSIFFKDPSLKNIKLRLFNPLLTCNQVDTNRFPFLTTPIIYTNILCLSNDFYCFYLKNIVKYLKKE